MNTSLRREKHYKSLNMQNPKNTKKLFISACEPSANLHLKYLSQRLDKSLHICGVFDPTIFSDFPHAKPLFSLKDFAVMGFFDVFKKLIFFKKAIAKASAQAKGCDIALLMDSSSFNIPIAKALRANGAKVKIVYYILPQVWAWKSWRAKQIAEVCDYLCAILPFELSMYPKGDKTQYVGHPLLDEISLKAKPTPLRGGKIAFMPGSRKGEIQKIFPIFVEVSKKLANPKILILPEHFKSLSAQELEQIYGEALKDFSLSFDANGALMDSAFAFVCSGTATLQATLIGTPLVLGYKTRIIDVAIARIFVKLKHIGLANILYNALHSGSPRNGERQIHPEFIQSQLHVENLLQAYCNTDVQKFFAQCLELRAYLKHGSIEAVSGLIERLLRE